jgi:type II secretory pathway pseudopilin PulG
VLVRLRGEKGFGMLELLMAMTMLNVGILALVASLQSGTVALRRAGKVSTASVLADSQMELYRGLKYTAIAFDTGEWTSAVAIPTYTTDPAYYANQTPQPTRPATVTCATPISSHPECQPIQSVTGPDRHRYRVDTYIVYDTPTNGRQLIKVTVVARDADDLTHFLARETSTFDQSTGQ